MLKRFVVITATLSLLATIACGGGGAQRRTTTVTPDSSGRGRNGDDDNAGADVISDKLLSLLEHDGDYYMHNGGGADGGAKRELARCELLIVWTNPQAAANYVLFEDMANLTDHSIPVNSLEDAVCTRFLVEDAGGREENGALGRYIYYKPGQNRLDVVLWWASSFAAFDHLYLIDQVDVFFWLDRIFLDLHSKVIGLAHTHPWLYWGRFETEDLPDGSNKLGAPDQCAVIVSANAVEELAILAQQQAGTPRNRDTTTVCTDLHQRITTDLHNSQMKPLNDRRFMIFNKHCHSSTLR